MGRFGGLSAEEFCLDQALYPVSYYLDKRKADPKFLKKILLSFFVKENPLHYVNKLGHILAKACYTVVDDRKIISDYIDDILIIDDFDNRSMYYIARIAFLNAWFECNCGYCDALTKEQLLSLIPPARVGKLPVENKYISAVERTFLTPVAIRGLLQFCDINDVVAKNHFCIPFESLNKRTAIEVINLLTEESCNNIISRCIKHHGDRRILFMFRELHPECITKCVLKNIFSDVGNIIELICGNFMSDIIKKDIFDCSELINMDAVDDLNNTIASYLMLNK